MYKEMRRKDKAMTAERVEGVLKEGVYGMLALTQPNGYPYAVPVNYVYEDGNVYIHCAKSGVKLDAIEGDSRASFTVVANEDVLPERFTSAFESVIAFGQATLVTDETQKIKMLRALIDKYSADYIEKGYRYVDSDHGKTAMIVFKPESKTGKVNHRLK